MSSLEKVKQFLFVFTMDFNLVPLKRNNIILHKNTEKNENKEITYSVSVFSLFAPSLLAEMSSVESNTL